MTAQTMSFRYDLACKDHSTEKAQDFVTQQNDLCCFIDLTFTLYLKLKFFTIMYYIHGPELMKLNFCRFMRVMNDDPYTLL